MEIHHFASERQQKVWCSGPLSRKWSLLWHTCSETGPGPVFWSHPKDRPIQSPRHTRDYGEFPHASTFSRLLQHTRGWRNGGPSLTRVLTELYGGAIIYMQPNWLTRSVYAYSHVNIEFLDG
jgi:hypothetical protein